VKYDALISTMPIDKLCNDMLNGDVPREIKKSTASLRHSGGYMVGIGIKQPCPSTKSWMYFPEENCPFYRVTYLSNYSPYMTPDKDTHYSLLCEVSYSEFKPVDGRRIVDDVVQGLINAGMLKESDKNDIVDTWVYDAKYSYPTPTVERDGILSEAIPFLEQHGIYSRGRFGMWKYEVANTDHSLMQGVELINRLLNGEAEQTIGIKYESTMDGRNAAVHERSALAGSGDPKKEAERAAIMAKLEAAKTNLEAAPAGDNTASRAAARQVHPGETQRHSPGLVTSGTTTTKTPTGRNQPGDKVERHVSEEELGVAAVDEDEE
jgi:hypothetical protein